MSFKVIRVSDENEMKAIYKLRYKVYCEEWGFEEPEKYHDRQETDEFDKNAVHFAAIDDSGKTVGTVRLILFSTDGFPIEKYCDIDSSGEKVRGEDTAEISRLIISRTYRKRTEDKFIYGPDEERRIIGGYNHSGNNDQRRTDDRYGNGSLSNGRLRNEMEAEKRNRHELVTALYKAVYHESKRRQLTHWYAVMTKGLVILLNRYGIRFQAIGDPVDYHGIRTPYLGEINKIEQEVSDEKPETYKELTEGL
ncbi:autoinducer synthetase [bacterium BMS3Bbin09]|nr:autoinducer synthetase [bacterium BMS3Bbin09]